MPNETRSDWIDWAKDNGWAGPLRLALDVLEPLGPLGAQLLWVAQPTLGIFMPTEALRDFAHTLEQPEGVSALRRQLDDDEQ